MPERWWDSDPFEIFWLEITDRDDLGTDLNAPGQSEEGEEYWSYAFVREVREGDVVFHYRARPNRSITHWSRATGEPYADEVVWGAHGQASGRGPVPPYPRPGWRRPLDGPYPLPTPISHLELQAMEPQIRAVLEQLQEEYSPRPLYFPFQISDRRPLRAFQGYLTKFPRALVEALPQLAEVGQRAGETRPTPRAPAPTANRSELGTDYRPGNPNARTARRQPFSVDPDLVDRALQSHARTQDALAAAVQAAGMVPRSPAPGEPVFDLAWDDTDGNICVAETKSVNGANDEKQLRLALGQVLRYGHLLKAKGKPVRHYIAVESRPQDESWIDLCDGLGVTLLWPDEFARVRA